MSEAAQNCLNTLLYHTSEPSSQFMLILATNRPQDLDEAMLDRYCDSLQLHTHVIYTSCFVMYTCHYICMQSFTLHNNSASASSCRFITADC
jgi:ATPase family associated with various cellular activities (AAA)